MNIFAMVGANSMRQAMIRQQNKEPYNWSSFAFRTMLKRNEKRNFGRHLARQINATPDMGIFTDLLARAADRSTGSTASAQHTY